MFKVPDIPLQNKQYKKQPWEIDKTFPTLNWALLKSPSIFIGRG
jgi:hypothetical protein